MNLTVAAYAATLGLLFYLIVRIMRDEPSCRRNGFVIALVVLIVCTLILGYVHFGIVVAHRG